MPLPTPVEMPSPLKVNSKTFDLNYVQSVSPSGAQFLQTIERAAPNWIAQYTTPPLSPENDQIFQAFLDSLEGAMVPFLAFDPRRPRPLAYLNSGSEPWVAAGQPAVRVVQSWYDSAPWGGVLALDRFVAFAQIKPGDYISYKVVNEWFLHRVRAVLNSDAGGNVSVAVTPRPPTRAAGVNITARLERACCTMKILGAVDKNDKVSDIGPVYSFRAIQFKDRSTD